jgi:hypothetical protein
MNSFFEPDVLTSHQYFQLFRQKSHFDAEEKLLFAVLTDAVECFQKYHGANAPGAASSLQRLRPGSQGGTDHGRIRSKISAKYSTSIQTTCG